MISISAATGVTAWNAPLPGAQSNSALENSFPGFQSVSVNWSGEVSGKTLMQDTCVQVQYTGVTLTQIISRVYEVPIHQIAGAGISAGNVLRERFDITATADHCIPLDQVRQMTQALVNERFKLVVQNESQSHKVYVLSAGAYSSQLQSALAGSPSFIEESGDLVVFRNQSIPMLCDFLRSIMDGPVLDHTGLKGSYDFSLKVQNRGGEYMPAPGSYFGDLSFESIRRSAQKLGLQFTIGSSQPPEIFVVDAEKPEPH